MQHLMPIPPSVNEWHKTRTDMREEGMIKNEKTTDEH